MFLKEDDRNILRSLYVHYRIPTDQFKVRPIELRELVDRFNCLTDRNDEPEDVLHYMFTQRKNGKWPRLGEKHKKMHSVEMEDLTVDEWAILDSIYLDFNVGSDHYAFNKGMRQTLEKAFAKQSKRFVSGSWLAAALERRRKQGLLPKLNPVVSTPFSDIDEIPV